MNAGLGLAGAKKRGEGDKRDAAGERTRLPYSSTRLNDDSR